MDEEGNITEANEGNEVIMTKTLNQLISCYRNDWRGTANVQRLLEALESRHEEVQNTRLIFETAEWAHVPDREMEALREHLLEIELQFSNLNEMVADRLAPLQKETKVL